MDRMQVLWRRADDELKERSSYFILGLRMAGTCEGGRDGSMRGMDRHDVKKNLVFESTGFEIHNVTFASTFWDWCHYKIVESLTVKQIVVVWVTFHTRNRPIGSQMAKWRAARHCKFISGLCAWIWGQKCVAWGKQPGDPIENLWAEGTGVAPIACVGSRLMQQGHRRSGDNGTRCCRYDPDLNTRPLWPDSTPRIFTSNSCQRSPSKKVADSISNFNKAGEHCW
jgi:hypothetical protein